MSTQDDVSEKYLDRQLALLAGDKRGEPDCYVVHKMLRGQIVDLLAIFKTKKSLYREFPKLVKDNALRLSCAGWWFDD